MPQLLWDHDHSGHCKEAESQERGGVSSPDFLLQPRKWLSQREPVHSSVHFLHALFPSSCEKFPVLWQINQSSKNWPDITSSCLHVNWSLKELNLFKIVTTFWKRGQSQIRDTRDFCSLSSSSRKLLKMNLARKAELGSPLAEFPCSLPHTQAAPSTGNPTEAQSRSSTFPPWGIFLLLLTASCAYVFT